MTFGAILDAVIKDAFAPTDRTDAKTWVNARLGQMWGAAEWSFRQGMATVTVTAGSSTVTGLPTDLRVPTALDRDDGEPLKMFREYRDFARRYVGTQNAQSGTPAAFVDLNGVLYVGPTPTATSSAYVLSYEKAFTALVADSDVPTIPVEYHLALVHGGKAEGMVMKNILLSDPPEAKWQEAMQAMRQDYLVSVRGAGEQIPAYRP